MKSKGTVEISCRPASRASIRETADLATLSHLFVVTVPLADEREVVGERIGRGVAHEVRRRRDASAMCAIPLLMLPLLPEGIRAVNGLAPDGANGRDTGVAVAVLLQPGAHRICGLLLTPTPSLSLRPSLVGTTADRTSLGAPIGDGEEI